MNIKQFKPGDTVVITEREPIGWEREIDKTTRNILATLKDDAVYTVSAADYEGDEIAVSLQHDSWQIYYHPNHFTVTFSRCPTKDEGEE